MKIQFKKHEFTLSDIAFVYEKIPTTTPVPVGLQGAAKSNP